MGSDTKRKKAAKELDEQLALAGIKKDEIEGYWLQCILDHRKGGTCSSVNFSTVVFIPVLSKVLAAQPTASKKA